jgi:toxin ParE1/3/4
VKYRLVIKQLADRELQVAAEYYGRIRVDLKDGFLKEVTQSLLLIEENPLRRAPNTLGVHQFTLSRFPFVISYVVNGNHVFVIAVLHEGRRSEEWEKRLE